MKKPVERTRYKLLAVLTAGLGAAGLASTVMAAGIGIGGGIGAGAGAGANAGAGVQVAPSVDVQAGGTAATHMNTNGTANSNAQWQSGATRGTDRAAERTPSTTDEEPEATTASSKGKRTDKR